MRNFFCESSVRLAIRAGILFAAMFVFTVSAPAGLMETLDETGTPLDLKVEVENDPDAFVPLMREEFARGNIDSAGYFAERLVALRPQLAEARAIYSIALAAGGKEDQAREQLEQARRLDARSLFTLCAEAISLQRARKFNEAVAKCEQAITVDPKHPYPRNILGRVQTDMGQPHKAVASFEKAVALKPDFLPGHVNLGAAAYLAGDYERSVASFTRAIELEPRSYAAQYGLAVVLETLGKNEEALRALRKSLELRPGNAAALESLGKLQLKQGLFTEALQTGREMEHKGLASAYVVLGDALLHTGKPDEARAALQKAPQDSVEVSYLLAFCDMVQERYDAAEKLMAKVLTIDPRHFGAYGARMALKMAQGQVVDIEENYAAQWDSNPLKLLHFFAGCQAISEKRWPEALKAFQASEGMINGYSLIGIDQTALASGTSHQEGRHLALGVLYYFKRLQEQSASEFSKALALNPDSILTNYWLAQVSLQKKDRLQAMQFLKNSLHKAPRFFAALYALGELHFLSGNADQAAELHRQALAVHKDPGLLIKLGLYSEQRGKYEEAARYYQETVDAFPEFFIGYNQLAWLLAKQGKELDRAMNLARKADALQPGNASILDTLGWIHFQKQEFAAAIPFLEKALGINPQNPTILYHLGKALLAKGDKEAGREKLRSALKISTAFEGAEEARRLLDKGQEGKQE